MGIRLYKANSNPYKILHNDLTMLPFLFLTLVSCSNKIEKKDKSNLQQPCVDS